MNESNDLIYPDIIDEEFKENQNHIAPVDDNEKNYLITEGNEELFNNSHTEVDEEYLMKKESIEIKDRSKLCYVCDMSQIDYFFACGNGLCNDCVKEHLKAQLDKYQTKILSNNIKFHCPGSCKCNESSKQMEMLMDQEVHSKYQDILFKMYLSKASDVIQCPRSSCPGYGFNSDDSSRKILNIFNLNDKCLECPICNHKWSDNSQYSLFSLFNIKNYWNKISPSNIKSVIKKYITTKYCNNCNAPIEKAEGCKHMECNRCDYSFCWKCTVNWSSHHELSCMGLLSNEYEESFRPDFIYTLLLFLFVVFLFKFLFSFIIIFYLIKIFIKLCVFTAQLVFVDAFFIYGAFRALFKYRNKCKFYTIIILALLIECILYFFELHPFSQKAYFYVEMITMPLYLVYGLYSGIFRR